MLFKVLQVVIYEVAVPGTSYCIYDAEGARLTINIYWALFQYLSIVGNYEMKWLSASVCLFSRFFFLLNTQLSSFH